MLELYNDLYRQFLSNPGIPPTDENLVNGILEYSQHFKEEIDNFRNDENNLFAFKWSSLKDFEHGELIVDVFDKLIEPLESKQETLGLIRNWFIVRTYYFYMRCCAYYALWIAYPGENIDSLDLYEKQFSSHKNFIYSIQKIVIKKLWIHFGLDIIEFSKDYIIYLTAYYEKLGSSGTLSNQLTKLLVRNYTFIATFFQENPGWHNSNALESIANKSYFLTIKLCQDKFQKCRDAIDTPNIDNQLKKLIPTIQSLENVQIILKKVIDTEKLPARQGEPRSVGGNIISPQFKIKLGRELSTRIAEFQNALYQKLNYIGLLICAELLRIYPDIKRQLSKEGERPLFDPTTAINWGSIFRENNFNPFQDDETKKLLLAPITPTLLRFNSSSPLRAIEAIIKELTDIFNATAGFYPFYYINFYRCSLMYNMNQFNFINFTSIFFKSLFEIADYIIKEANKDVSDTKLAKAYSEFLFHIIENLLDLELGRARRFLGMVDKKSAYCFFDNEAREPTDQKLAYLFEALHALNHSNPALNLQGKLKDYREKLIPPVFHKRLS